MKRLVIAAALFTCWFPAIASASLDAFLNDLNVQARADLGDFTVRLGAQFGVPVPQVQAILRVVNAPADAFMVFQLGQMARKPPEVVLQTYRNRKGKGWGVIAKQLGIQPGSREFHALKNGDLVFTGVPAAEPASPAAKGKGKGKGPNK